MVTEDNKKFLGQFQSYQQQLQAILIQKENLKLQMLELERALEDLKASKGKEAYKITGPIMIKKTKTELKKELKQRKENFDLRVKTLEKAEERITKKLKEMEPKLRKMLEKQG
jgi:prefoldin beta subunit